MTRLLTAVLAAALVLTLSACAYDYAQHTDRVAFSAGDAVHANLERETTNPTKRSMFSTAGLARNGAVIPTAPTVD